MKIRKNFIVTGVLFVLFLIFTWLVMNVDVNSIGPEGSHVGLATLNQTVHKMIGVHILWYDITDWLGVVAILIALGFGVLGFIQFIKRKSLFKVDTDIILLGGYYLVVIALYIFFEIFIVNYRPIILNDSLEASFPSSHAMIVTCIMMTAMIQFKYRIKNSLIKNVTQVISLGIVVVTVIGRLISGVHWMTDIVAGILLSAVLVSAYHSFYILLRKGKK